MNAALTLVPTAITVADIPGPRPAHVPGGFGTRPASSPVTSSLAGTAALRFGAGVADLLPAQPAVVLP